MNSANLHSPDKRKGTYVHGEDVARMKHYDAEVKREKRYNFQRAVFDLESDAYLAELMKMGRGRKDAGILRSMVEELNNFEDQYLGDEHDSADAKLQLKELEGIFSRSMNKLIVNWGDLQSKYDWATIAFALEGHMSKAAKVVGLDKELKVNIKKWFSDYQRKQKLEKQYVDRDKLNMEALQAHQQLAYYKTNGGSKEVIEDIRAKIKVIDDQLKELPVDPEFSPAFSELNPRQKVLIRGETRVNDRVKNQESEVKEFKKSRWAESEDAVISARKMQEMKAEQKARKLAEEKPVGGVRGFLKKIPLLGRLF